MQGNNKVLFRYAGEALQGLLRGGHSGLILGPRQVGKTTLVHRALEELRARVLEYPLQNPDVRLDMERRPGRLIDQVRATGGRPWVFVDEAQKVPEIFDAVQVLIDERRGRFLLTGSSARKLRRHGMNLLPGRLKSFRLDPLLWGELGLLGKGSVVPLEMENINQDVGYSFEESLVYGALPGIVLLQEKDRSDFLRAYAQIYLEEEIRAEALSRKIGAFARFLELAAAESGTSPNFAKLSNEAGVSQPAIREFYGLLEDTLVVERVDPFLKNARKRILSSPRHYFFDTGVRNALARFPLERGLARAQKGPLFEQAVVLEVLRRVRALNKPWKVNYWRTAAGAEVDCVLDMGDRVIPIEIKSSAHVVASELKGLKNFLEDYPTLAHHGYVVTMGTRPERLADNITAVPWFDW